MPYLLLGLTVVPHPKPLGCIPTVQREEGGFNITSYRLEVLATLAYYCMLVVFLIALPAYIHTLNAGLTSNLNVALFVLPPDAL